MFRLLKRVKNSSFLKDNFILFVGTFLTGILGFVYHFYMGRVLGVVSYGVLGTILAAFYLFNAAFVNTIQTSIAKFTSDFNSRNENGKIKYLIYKSFKKLFLVGILIYLVYFLLTPWISSFLYIERGILILSGLLIILSLLIPIGRGLMQGMQDFKGLSLNLIIEGIVKLSFGIIFVYMSYKVMGAISAIIFAFIIPIIFFIRPLKKFKSIIEVPFETKSVYIYSFPVFIMIISLTLFFSIDVVLVKHLFTESDAGLYSALSLLGKIIFFGTISISQVMFPKVSELHTKEEKTFKLFLKSLGVVGFCIFCALFVYFIFPKLLVLILFGKEFLPMVGLVGWFGLFISIISIIYLISFYLMSLKKFKFIYLLVLFNIIQVLLIFKYHQSLFQVVSILVVLMFILLLCLVFWVFYIHRDIFKKPII